MTVLAYLFGFFAALFLLLAAAAWLKVARSSAVTVSSIRPAAWLTGIAFALLGVALLLAAVGWAAETKLRLFGLPAADAQSVASSTST